MGSWTRIFGPGNPPLAAIGQKHRSVKTGSAGATMCWNTKNTIFPAAHGVRTRDSARGAVFRPLSAATRLAWPGACCWPIAYLGSTDPGLGGPFSAEICPFEVI